jgi:hypothetical protein
MSLLERATKAIRDQMQLAPLGLTAEQQQEFAARYARAAIEALREPTDAMCQAMVPVIPWASGFSSDPWTSLPEIAGRAFNAAVCAALSEVKP